MTDPRNHWAALSSLLGVEYEPEEPQPTQSAAEPATAAQACSAASREAAPRPRRAAVNWDESAGSLALSRSRRPRR